jgi:hypothetical protein
LHGLLTIKNIRIPKKFGDPLYPSHYDIFGWTEGYFQKLSYGSETSDMTSEGMGEMFEGDSADTCARKFPLALMGGPRGGTRVPDPGAVSGN